MTQVINDVIIRHLISILFVRAAKVVSYLSRCCKKITNNTLLVWDSSRKFVLELLQLSAQHCLDISYTRIIFNRKRYARKC